jgi:hypothetical protein
VNISKSFFALIRITRGVLSVRSAQTSSNYRQYELALHTYDSSGAVEGEGTITSYTVLSSSTFLDLKLLILNRTNVPLSLQVLEIRDRSCTRIGEDNNSIGGPDDWYPRYEAKLNLKGL